MGNDAVDVGITTVSGFNIIFSYGLVIGLLTGEVAKLLGGDLYVMLMVVRTFS